MTDNNFFIRKMWAKVKGYFWTVPKEAARASSGEPGAERIQRAFLANLRHELRTPLNAIIGYSEMLLEDAEDEGLEDLIPDLQKIHTAGQELLALVNDILDPAKIQAGELDLNPETIGAKLNFELRTPLNAVIGYTEMLLEDAKDAEQADLLPDLQKIHTAARRFLTLLSDVVNFSRIEAGEIVTDLEAAATSSMIRDAVTTIRPLVEDDADSVSVERGYLLVVDDNEMNRDTLSRHLERQGHTVAVAENGRQALAMVKTHFFDLVLLDIMMPEMNGYQVLQRLKDDDTWRDIPVIMISALDEIDSVVRCIEMGAEDYLPKPFDPVLLRARISACLEKKRLRDQEVAYLQNVARVTAAAAAVEAGEFEPESLADVAQRTDGLGQLARVFQSMAREVYAREQRLKQ
ncbi:MAG: response regulator, partial [Anaerolineae bacterium]|nr:response regulator [Anaerolineae bacterium]